MNVLVIGHGGREHALAWRISQSPLATRVFCAPGNSGTALEGTNVRIAEDDHREILRFVKKESIELVVIGPEAPLVAGLADVLRASGALVFGPSRDAALLEGSKVFCKRFLRRANIPSADFHVFSDMESVERYFEAHPGPCVVKADGLAAGKGAIVCDGAPSARVAAMRMLVDREFGAAGDQILIEERLVGEEVSVLAITDGSTLLTLDPCQDHKRAFDGDEGPNTGGMGAYCPAPVLSAEQLAAVERDILVPTLHQLRREKRPFQGVLYAGLMMTSSGPKVLEYNVRFGDPECPPLLMRIKTDVLELLVATAKGELRNISLEWDPRPAVCVVMASGGYPGLSRKGLPIRGLDEASAVPGVKVFHAGAALEDGRVVTNGGRVLGVTALGDDLRAAKDLAYQAVGLVRFTGAMVRTDIADKAIARPV